MVEDKIADDLLKTQNYTQALKHVTKKLKKAPNDKVILSYKARIVHLLADHDEAVRVCKEIASTPVTDFDLLRTVQNLLHDIQLVRERTNDPAGAEECCSVAETLWKGAVKAQKSSAMQIDFISEWIALAVETAQWPSLVQAALAMEQALPKSDTEGIRNHWYLQILARWLVATQSHLTPKTQGMQRMLASGIIEKALTAVPVEPTTTPGKWIATKSELALLAQILAESPAKLLQLLETKGLDPKSTVNQNSLGAFAIGQEALRRLGKHDDLRAASWAAIRDAEKAPREDWRWEQLQYWEQAVLPPVDSLTKDSDPNNSLLDESLQKVLDSPHAPRAARVSIVWLLRNQLFKERNHGLLSEKWEQVLVQQYIAEQKSALTPASLKNLVYYLTADRDKVLPEQAVRILELLEKVMSQNAESATNNDVLRVEYEAAVLNLRLAKAKVNLASKLETRVQDLEFPYATQSKNVSANSTAENWQPHLKELRALVRDSISQYPTLAAKTAHLLETDYDPANEVLTTAAHALFIISIAPSQEHQGPRLLAATLLKSIVEQRKQDARSRSLLVNVLRSLGLNSLADEAFSTLRIKGITTEKCYPSYFQRIASIHPSSTSNAAPFKQLQKHLTFVSDAVDTMWEYILLANEKGNYHSAHDFVVELQRLKQSPSRALCMYERRRIERFGGSTKDGSNLEKEAEFKRNSFQKEDPKSNALSIHGITVLPNDVQWTRTQLSEYPLDQSKIQKEDPLTLPPSFPAPFTPHYALYLRIVDSALHDLIYNIPTIANTHSSGELELLSPQVTELAQSTHLTRAEQVTLTPAFSLGRFAETVFTLTSPPLKMTVEQLAALRSTISEMVESFDALWTLASSRLPTWENLQYWYLEYEILRATVLVCRRIPPHLNAHAKKEKGTADYTKLEEAAKEANAFAVSTWTKRRNMAASWRNKMSSLDNDTMLEFIVGGDDGAEIKPALIALGQAKIGRIAGSFAQSSLESVDCVLKLKIDA